MNSPATLLSTMIRSVAMQIWPECMKAPKLAALTASSRSASAITIIGALPPSSSRHFFRCAPHFSAMILPTFVEPVKLIRRVPGWAISASITSGASPGSLVR